MTSTIVGFVVDEDGLIINAVVLDGSGWTPPEGCTLAYGDLGIGGHLVNGVYTPPEPTPGVPVS